MVLLQVSQHVGRVSSLTCHLLLAQLTGGKAVILQLAVRVYKILKIIPDPRAGRAPRREVPRGSPATFYRRGVVVGLLGFFAFGDHSRLENMEPCEEKKTTTTTPPKPC